MTPKPQAREAPPLVLEGREASRLQGAVLETLEWWSKILKQNGVDTWISQQALLASGRRPTRSVALARRRLAKQMVKDVGPELAKKWLAAITAWSRFTVANVIREHSF